MRQRLILSFLRECPRSRLSDIAAGMAIGEPSIRNTLQLLEHHGRVRRGRDVRRGCFGQRVHFSVFDAVMADNG